MFGLKKMLFGQEDEPANPNPITIGEEGAPGVVATQADAQRYAERLAEQARQMVAETGKGVAFTRMNSLEGQTATAKPGEVSPNGYSVEENNRQEEERLSRAAQGDMTAAPEIAQDIQQAGGHVSSLQMNFPDKFGDMYRSIAAKALAAKRAQTAKEIVQRGARFYEVDKAGYASPIETPIRSALNGDLDKAEETNLKFIAQDVMSQYLTPEVMQQATGMANPHDVVDQRAMAATLKMRQPTPAPPAGMGGGYGSVPPGEAGPPAPFGAHPGPQGFTASDADLSGTSQGGQPDAQAAQAWTEAAKTLAAMAKILPEGSPLLAEYNRQIEEYGQNALDAARGGSGASSPGYMQIGKERTYMNSQGETGRALPGGQLSVIGERGQPETIGMDQFSAPPDAPETESYLDYQNKIEDQYMQRSRDSRSQSAFESLQRGKPARIIESRIKNLVGQKAVLYEYGPDGRTVQVKPGMEGEVASLDKQITTLRKDLDRTYKQNVQRPQELENAGTDSEEMKQAAEAMGIAPEDVDEFTRIYLETVNGAR